MSDDSPNRRPLRQVLEKAAEDDGCSLSDLTVLSSDRDPYRLDTPAGHRDGQWLAQRVERFLGGTATIHLRGLHYRISASADVRMPNGLSYTNTDACWEWFADKSSKASRWLGYVPFERIVDERNAPPELFIPEPHGTPYPLFSGGLRIELPHTGDGAYPALFTGPWPERQPYRIILIGEKVSLRSVLLPIAQQVGGELLLPTGEISDTLLAELAARAVADGRPVAVLDFSDFDPSGWQMPISIARKLQALRDLLHPELDIQVHRVALTLSQVRALGLPSTPLKETERRADRWRERMGHEQTEVDALLALNPAELSRIAREAVAPFFDATLHRRVYQAHLEWAEEARARLEEHPAYQAVIGEIDSALENARLAVDTFHGVQDQARDQLESEVEPPEIVVPESEIVARAPEPLFDSKADYVNATQKLIRQKQLAEGIDSDGENNPIEQD